MFGILARAARLPIITRCLGLAKGPIKQRYRYSSTNGAGGPNQAPPNPPADTARMWERLGHVEVGFVNFLKEVCYRETGVCTEMASMMGDIKRLGWQQTAALTAFTGSFVYAAYTVNQVKRDLPNTIQPFRFQETPKDASPKLLQLHQDPQLSQSLPLQQRQQLHHLRQNLTRPKARTKDRQKKNQAAKTTPLNTTEKTAKTKKTKRTSNLTKPLTKNNYIRKEPPSLTQTKILTQQDKRHLASHLQDHQALTKSRLHPQVLHHYQAPDPPLCLSNQKAVAAPNGQHHSSIQEKEKTKTH
ncbi:hypothetical protein B9Z19DRAFT_1197733 [Tuber borchii]|uniref:Uncharacterized protein n=1 Tax=Tuber borchii TaxID=42251 RepID=A0A2T6Z9H8_TUBBO|nr:hypothetical protein B9Z19DRAFT_1197733 [Tuber borchii]